MDYSHKPYTEYEYTRLPPKDPTTNPPQFRLACKRKPDGRFIQTSYDSEGRVSSQKAPVGTDQTPIETHRFVYRLSGDPHQTGKAGGETEVYDAYSRKTVYAYNQDHLLIAVKKFTADQLYATDHYIWDDSYTHSDCEWMAQSIHQVLKRLFPQLYEQPTPTDNELDRGQTPPPPNLIDLAEQAKEEADRPSEAKTIPLTKGHLNPHKAIQTMMDEMEGFQQLPAADFPTLLKACLKAPVLKRKGKGNLIGTYKEASGHIEAARFLDYDRKGNILQERFYGNLTGTCRHPISLTYHQAIKENGIECYSKKFAYTQDHFNLVHIEQEDNGKGKIYSYVPNTDLVQAQYITDQGKMAFRRFYEYDDKTTLVKIIKDNEKTFYHKDLDGVTERHVTYITPRSVAPFGLPERIDEMYLDWQTGEEKLLKRVVCDYTADGRLSRQDHYDSNGLYRYSLSWEYDSHGNVVMERNALGQVIEKAYDANDNLICEKGPCHDFWTAHTYDYANRLIRSEEIHTDGTYFTTSHRYDYTGNRVASVDRYGQETLYSYDELNRLVKTVSPAVLNEEGSPVYPSMETAYDAFDRPISIIDANGHETYTTYNARGKPISVLHPDGTVERFEYHLDGTLAKSIAPNGTETHYQRDFLGRATKEEVWANGSLLSAKSFHYEGLRLSSMVDAEGFATHYSYDGAGRLILEEKESQCKQLTYDPLNRLAAVTQWFGYGLNDKTVRHFTYDLLGHVTEEKLTDGNGLVLQQTSYAYDAFGNCVSVAQLTEAGPSVTRTAYNTDRQPIALTDAEGHQSFIHYDHAHPNELGQFVLKITKTDAQGKNSESIHDALGRVVQATRKDQFGSVIANQRRYYDAAGQLKKVLEDVMADGILQRTYCYAWHYNARGQETAVIEALGTAEQKITHTRYNAFGQKEQTVKPSGVKLLYRYDRQRRLRHFTASDQSFAYAYCYNRNHQVVAVQDLNNQTITMRQYDRLGQLNQETLGNGLSTSYQYDRQGRCKQILLPDGSGIGYQYDAAFLREVSRLKNGIKLYSHAYQAYDQAGSLLRSQLIGQAGQASYGYDRLRRQRRMQTAAYSQAIPEKGYDETGRLTAKQVEDLLGIQDYRFDYNALDRLQSEQGHQTHTYQTDSISNRLEKDGNKYTLNSLNQLLAEKDRSYQYDPEDNLIQKTQNGQATHYRYDALNRLIQVRSPQGTTTYVYDAFNRRLSKTSQGVQERYLYQGQNEIGMVDSQGCLQELRLLGAGHGAELGAAIALELKSRTLAPVHDNQGHVVSLIDAATGKPCEAYRYTAFGEEAIANAQGERIQTSSVGNPWRFASKRVDPETGWIYFGRRYYDPTIGRWTTADPLGFADGPNLYAYLHHSPLSAFDAYGLVGEAYRDGCDAAYCSPYTDDLFDKDLEYFDTYYSSMEAFKNIWAGRAHGCCDFVADNACAITGGACLIGADTADCPLEERWEYIRAFFQYQDEKKAEFDNWFQHAVGASQNSAMYQNNRHITFLALEWGSFVAGSYGAAKGTWQLGKFAKASFQASKGIGKGIAKTVGAEVKYVAQEGIKDAGKYAESLVGHNGWELKNKVYQPVRNPPTVINGHQYSGHAVDQMQNRGLMPSVIENTIEHGNMTAGKRAGTIAYYDSTNNTTVIINNQNGQIITTGWPCCAIVFWSILK